MADGSLFLGRTDEVALWDRVLAAARAAQPDQCGSHAVIVHGIGGMGKSVLTRRLVQLTADARYGGATPPAVLVDLEIERDRWPERYPALQGAGVGTLLYTIERELCEKLGARGERAFADFRGVLGQIVAVARDGDRADAEASGVDGALSDDERQGIERVATLVGGLIGVPLAEGIVGASLGVGAVAGRLTRIHELGSFSADR